MHTYILEYRNGDKKEVQASTSQEVVKKYDLATRENIHTVVTQIS